MDIKMKEKILNWIKEELFWDGDVDLDISLLDQGIIDSLGVLNLVEFLEKEFNIKIGDDEVTPENLGSINLMVKFIEKKNERT